MKWTKKVFSLLIAVCLTVCSVFTAFAGSNTVHTITITNSETGHQYTAYQVFKGDFYDGKLSNIKWGDGVNSDTLLTALKADTTYGSNYEKCTTAADVADVLAKFSNDSEQLENFSKYVNDNLSGTSAGTSTEETGSYKINVTGDGYYFVKDTGTIGEGKSATKYILQVIKDISVKAKADTPSVDKKIVEGEGESEKVVEANTASIGDDVDYRITSKVPDMTHYKKYYFIVHDTLSKGLTFNNDLTIKVGAKTLESGTDYVLTTEKNTTSGETDIKIVFNNFYQYKDQKEAAIVIEYSATVNEDAEIGTKGNTNDVILEYSNNPNVIPEGANEPGENDGDVTGKTPKDYVTTYVTGIEVIKVDGSENKNRLAGAEFELTGTKLNKVKVVKETFTKDENGTYYKLKDGSYTEQEPTTETENKYESITEKYTVSTTVEWNTTTEKVSAKAEVSADGKVVFDGLAEGEYTIEEIKAPNGYNLLKAPIKVTITCTHPDVITTGDETATWTATIDKGGNTEAVTSASDSTGRISITVENKSGATLPSTGGIGTTAFYIVGGAMVVVALVLLVSKKRMDYKK